MGLDMYLSARKYVSDYAYENGKNTFEIGNILESVGLDRSDLSEDSPSATVSITIAYWRKANAIHNWFIENVAGGVDDCQPFHVSREELQELCDDIKDVLNVRDLQNANPDEALPTPEDILPTQSGFFFGGTDYDEYYWEYLESTLDRLRSILGNPTFEDFDFEYRASW
jgi:hypothetical protein